MIHSCAMHVLLAGLLICLGAGEAWAQKGATGPVADLNAEAKALSDSDPERSLALAQPDSRVGQASH